MASNEVRLVLGCDLEIGVAEAISAGQEPAVLDPGVDEADVCPHPDEDGNRQNEECEHVETVAELGRVGSKSQRNDGRRHDSQEDVGPTVDRTVCDVPCREQAPMFGREDLDAHGLRHVEVRVGGHRASSISRAEPSSDPVCQSYARTRASIASERTALCTASYRPA